MARVATTRRGGRASENFGEAETITEFRNRSCPGLRPRVGAEADAEVADEATALLAAREIGERLVERRGVPVRRAPLVVREEFVVTANGRQRLSWVQLADVTGSPRMVRVSREGAGVRHTSSLCTFGAGLRRRVPR
jgi:hypothetical protein